GVVPDTVNISGNRARPGDAIIISGNIGDHGIAVLSRRANLEFGTIIKSDSAALHGLVADMIKTVPDIHCLRDPTRGGLATSLNELAKQSGVGMQINEIKIPLRTEVAAACELLGLDPLYIANEGKLVAICAAADSEQLLSVMRDHHLGRDAAIIGEVITDKQHLVQMQTIFGGQRLVDWLVADQLPRIC
ncbi:MAG TPA: hydrogenase expression/formation protein HypE, partial [Candidatus Tenderia electrophaga]|nr:hydrogenase expression/formation protein HypE [Candidatus Tenderia electrophaga]